MWRFARVDLKVCTCSHITLYIAAVKMLLSLVTNIYLGLILIDPFEKCLTGAIQFVAYISAVLMLANYITI